MLAKRQTAASAIRAVPVARSAAMVWIPSKVKYSFCAERPRASFDAILLGVLWMAGMCATMHHMLQNQSSQWAVFLRKLARDEAIHFGSSLWWRCSGDYHVRVRQASFLILHDTDGISRFGKKRTEERHRLLQSGVKDAHYDIRAIHVRLTWQ